MKQISSKLAEATSEKVWSALTGIDIATGKRKCFGEWLDTCLDGFRPCRTCEDLAECQQAFQDSCEKTDGGK
ncbi:MAG: hypothetical protein ABSD42_10515 [Candidatus Bathyarchaeia archaeon]